MKGSKMTSQYKKALIYAGIAVLGGLIFGLDAGIIAGAIKYIKAQFDLTPMQVGTVVSAPALGANIALFFTGWFVAHFGRKKTLILIAGIYLCSALGCATATNYYMLIVARLLGGMAYASISVTSMYLGEITPPRIRGKMISANQLMMGVGLFIAYLINYLLVKYQPQDPTIATHSFIFSNEHIWRFMFLAVVGPCLAWFVLLFFVIESPRWLALQKRHDEARALLSKVIDPEDFDNVMNGILDNISKVKKISIRWQVKTLFSERMKILFLICLGIALCHPVAGMGVISYYAPLIFEQVGLGATHALFLTILMAILGIVASGITILFVDKVGRRPIFIIGAIAILLSYTTVWYSFNGVSYNLSQSAVTKFVNTNQNTIAGYKLTPKLVDTINDNQELSAGYLKIKGSKPTVDDYLTPAIENLFKTQESTTEIFYKEQTNNPIKIDFKPLQDNIGKVFNSDIKFKAFLSKNYNKYFLDVNENIFIKKFINFKTSAYLIVGAIFLFKFSFFMGVGPLAWLLLAEIMPNSVRSFSIPFLAFVSGIFAWATQKFFPWELANLGASNTFLIYVILALITLIFIVVCVPETKDKTIEQLEKELIKDK